ncbi:MAG: DNA-binding helix-turn-helix protein [Desulfotomaculum sp. 46_296]|nr:MAG: DNA-binding helix-turn-helix protein [Desulfotomaculum sp. 46_296]KUK85432.1 MAG: DNA-binding helix-turn-helix protein [Desulfofundulus kuznetsovii]HBY03348.1 DUF739 domain-containing protein [Desulfotomaculum sp.]
MANNKKQPFRALKGKLVEEGMTIKELAAELGMTPGTLSRKLNNRSSFFMNETVAICRILGIESEVNKYFFSVYKKELQGSPVFNNGLNMALN